MDNSSYPVIVAFINLIITKVGNRMLIIVDLNITSKIGAAKRVSPKVP